MLVNSKLAEGNAFGKILLPNLKFMVGDTKMAFQTKLGYNS
jgi:hypothetical protein